MVVLTLLLSELALAVPLPPGKPVLDLEFHRRLPPSELKVTITPAAEIYREGGILVLTARIRNESRTEIRTTLAHEWHGGEWPPTHLFASVTPTKDKRRRPFVPVYLAGENSGRPRTHDLPSGEGVDVLLRMDWPGTGSVKTTPLVQETGDYTVELLTVFEVNGRKQYATSEVKVIRVRGK